MTAVPIEGQTLDVIIDDLAYGGEGVAHPDGFAVFVPRSAPGDRVRVRIEAVRRRYARAMPLEILETSPHRIQPKCAAFDRCGGCQSQHMRDNFLTEIRHRQLGETLTRLGPGPTPIDKIWLPKDQWNYRNRVTYHRTTDGKQGYVAWDHSGIVDIVGCPISHPELNDLWQKVRDHLPPIAKLPIPFVVLRRSSIGQLAVIVSFVGQITDVVLKQVLSALSLLPEEISLWATSIRQDAFSPFGKELQHLRGPETIRERFASIDFDVRPDLFFQIHPEVAEEMLSRALAWARDAGAKSILDLYCGAGFFSLPLAKAGHKTLGIEVHYPAILSAQASAERNELSERAEFRGGKADVVLPKLARTGQRFDAILVDPPRRGLTPVVLDSIGRLGAKHLLYVSCSPPTMARDMKELAKLGFEIRSIEPLDMFPQTYHVETMTKLEFCK